METTHLRPTSPADHDDVTLCGQQRVNEVSTIQEPYGTGAHAIEHFGYCVACIDEYRAEVYAKWVDAKWARFNGSEFQTIVFPGQELGPVSGDALARAEMLS